MEGLPEVVVQDLGLGVGDSLEEELLLVWHSGYRLVVDVSRDERPHFSDRIDHLAASGGLYLGCLRQLVSLSQRLTYISKHGHFVANFWSHMQHGWVFREG